MPTAPVILLSLAVLGAPAPPTLPTLASASPRPRVCRLGAGSLESELWARVRRERAERFCVLLARGYVRLERQPAEAAALAREAGKILPNEAEPRVLLGRALLRMGELEAARDALVASVTAPGRPLGDVAGLRELGIALTLTGRLREAADAYRVLVPRIGFLEDRLLARVAVLEAAAAFMASSPEGAAEAALHLAEARQSEPVPGFQDLTIAMLAVALDRDGKSEQAMVLLEELAGPWSLEQFVTAAENARLVGVEEGPGASTREAPSIGDRAPVLAEGEIHAAIGLAAFRKDPKLAAQHLRAFEKGPGGKGPWAAWARTRLAALPRGDGSP